MYMKYGQGKRKHADSTNNPTLEEYPRRLDYTCVYVYICIDIGIQMKYGKGKRKHAVSNNNPMLVEYPRSLDYIYIYVYMYIYV